LLYGTSLETKFLREDIAENQHQTYSPTNTSILLHVTGNKNPQGR
jgi:hypothetical protein